jgi:predicted permease
MLEWMKIWLRRLWQLRSEEEREIRKELLFHLDRLTDEYREEGMSRRQARRQALKRFGKVGYVEQECVEANGFREEIYKGEGTMKGLLNDLGQDIRYGLRTLRKNPGFTAVAVLTLALGIGANTAIFSVVNAVLLEPLPYPNPEELTIVWQVHEAASLSRAPSSPLQLLTLRESTEHFQDLGGIWATTGTLTGDGDPEQVKAGMVTANFLSEEGGGRPAAVILSHSLWQRRYGGDVGVVGRTVRYQGIGVTVVGIMPKGFQMPFPADASVPSDIQLWTPFAVDIYAAPAALYYLRILGRLKPEANLVDAQQEASAIAGSLRAEIPDYSNAQVNFEVLSLHQDAVRHIRPALLALFAGVGMVLLIACVNVANLLLAKANGRRKEMVLRSALGAGRGRIARQLLTESLLLAGLGGAAGIGIGEIGSRVLATFQPADLARSAAPEMNLMVLIFALAVTVLSGVLFGLVPVLETAKINLMESLREGARDSRSAGRRWLSGGLVVGEIALGFVLLMGAGLLAQTFVRLLAVDPGFQPENVLTFEIGLPRARYRNDADRTVFFRQLRARLAEQPGVEEVGAISHLPLDDFPNWYSPYAPEGAEIDGSATMADHRATAAGYFEAIGAKLLAGKFYDSLDEEAGRSVVVVDETLARRTWPGEVAVGKRLQVEFMQEGSFETNWAEVVGVIKHIHQHDLAVQLRGQIYIPYPLSARRHQSFVVRTSGDPRTLIPTVREEVAKLDANLALSKVRPMTEYLRRSGP